MGFKIDKIVHHYRENKFEIDYATLFIFWWLIIFLGLLMAMRHFFLFIPFII